MILKAVLCFLTLFTVITTFLPFIRNDYWIFRVLEYLRLQKLIVGVAILLTILATRTILDDWFWWLIVPLGVCVIYLCTQVLPYTFLGTTEMHRVKKIISGAGLKIFTANVLQDNRDYERMLQQIRAEDPDIIFLVETDKKWEEATQVLEKDYPQTLKKPLDNTYGLLFYSRLEVTKSKINFLVEADVPSIELTLLLANGIPVKIFGLHPKPPVPYEAMHSTAKDKELMKIALAIENNTGPCVVIGDLNDVAWSRITKLFRKVSGLLDPRLGRGFYSTFSAKNKLVRFPLDYIFCSAHFLLQSMKKLPYNCSDHFAMFIHLQYEELSLNIQHKQSPNKEEKQQAIEEATQETNN
jgi:endonuclease/exonuclease/phosphatase (EEP) superfamily protein YafD